MMLLMMKKMKEKIIKNYFDEKFNFLSWYYEKIN
jgi:hypothetical protein